MNLTENEIIKKCESIDLVKQDLNNIKRFEEIYSNFKIQNIPQNYPKIIRDSEPSSIILNEDYFFFDEQNYNIEKNLTYFMSENSLFALSQKEDSKNNNIKAKSFIELKQEKLSKKALEEEIRKNLEYKKEHEFINKKQKYRKQIHDKIEKMKKNKLEKRKSIEKIHFSKVYNVKYNNNKNDYKRKRKSTMKDIYQHFFGINDEISLSTDKRSKINNAFQRLYNQGFYTKNKSQINILKNIKNIKKESRRENISKNSKKILKKKNVKYDKNNIFKPIKTNMEKSYIKFKFHPNLNETTKNIVKNMEKSFTRIMKPKNKTKIVYNKRKISKEKYEQILNRINFLYLDGVEKIKKKKKSISCPPSNEISFELREENINDYLNKSLMMKMINNKSRNIYNKQIQWKKKLLLENEKKIKMEENKKFLECTFKPKINTKSIKYLFQKTNEEILGAKINKNNSNSVNKQIKKLNISQYRYFIIN